MRNYTWIYGIFHWLIHYLLTWAVIVFSGVTLIPVYWSVTFFGTTYSVAIVDIIIGFIITTLIDVDHLVIVFKLGFSKVVFAEKRLVQPFHNFFFLSMFSLISLIFALFISKEIAVLIFLIPLHMLWDISEDVFIFKTSFRRWEKTWGLNSEDLEAAYNELLQIEATKPKKESRIKKIKIRLKERRAKIRERVGRKKKLETVKQSINTGV